MRSNDLKDKKIALFFTVGISLKKWHELGMIDREIAIYNELSKNFEYIYFFTYGEKEDLEFRNLLADNIIIIPKKYFKNHYLYSLFLPLIHYKTLKNVDILKTNQMQGSWSAVLSKILYRKKLVIRTGYTLSKFTEGINKKISKLIERVAYSFADGTITTSKHDYEYIQSEYGPSCVKKLIPNFIDTEKFRPLNLERNKGSICFVGRLNPQKNLFELLKSLKYADYTLTIIGSGEQEQQLKEFARINAIDVKFFGNVANNNLPIILNQHELFILPSLFEGMPKTLLEAMSCGMPVIGTDVEGINEVILDGHDGLLCDKDSKSIRKTIDTAMKNEIFRNNLGRNARKKIILYYSLKEISRKELNFLEEIILI